MTKMNNFTKANILKAGNARTENGAISYSTLGSNLLDQFGKAGCFRNRDIQTVWDEQSLLWAEDPTSALRFPFFLRMITRKTKVTGNGASESVQRGSGARDEAFKRLLWIAKNHPDEFYRNLWLLPVVGSWKDLWTLLCFEGSNEYLNKDAFFEVMKDGLADENACDLVKKYLPRIRSNKQCTTPYAVKCNNMAKAFCNSLGWSYEDYRRFKSVGKAHEFQRTICGGRYGEIKWNTIPGQALLNMVNGKFLGNHNLTENFAEWLKQQPTAKFNGYAFDLVKACEKSRNLVQRMTIDKQFDGLIKTASSNGGAIMGNVLCALDTSGSMQMEVVSDKGVSAYDVCISLGIYFSELNQGAFHNTVAMFDHTSSLMTLNGTFSEKYYQIKNATTAWGDTNFQSLIDLIVETRVSNPDMPLEDFPSTLLVVSDMQFNPASYNWSYVGRDEQSNYEEAMRKLSAAFPKEFVDNFKIIWWFCSNDRTTDFPSTMDHKGTYMMSGFDGSIVSFLLGGEGKVEGESKTPDMNEMVQTALNQEVLAMVN